MSPESSSTQRISCSVYADKKVHSQEMRRSPKPADINGKIFQPIDCLDISS